MKKIFFSLTLLFALVSFAQDKKTLETDAARFYKNMTVGNYEALIADTYPKIFEFIPKDKMLETLKGTLKGDGYVLDILEEPANFEFGEVKNINGGQYCLVKHDLVTKMTFTQPLADQEVKGMTQNFKQAMKTDNVVYNPRSNSFTIKKRVDIIAISNSATTGKWKFLNRTGEKLMAQLLDKDVRSQLGV